MQFLDGLMMALFSACVAVIFLYILARYLQLADWPKTKLKQQLYQSGETVTPRERRYLERTFIWLSYFSTAHVVSLFLATLLVLTAFTDSIEIIYPLIYIMFASFSILTLAKQIKPVL
ncbi:MAG: hypothetical protein ACTSRU_20035 [Candidatus Hodarchaeales archaeon]